MTKGRLKIVGFLVFPKFSELNLRYSLVTDRQSTALVLRILLYTATETGIETWRNPQVSWSESVGSKSETSDGTKSSQTFQAYWGAFWLITLFDSNALSVNCDSSVDFTLRSKEVLE